MTRYIRVPEQRVPVGKTALWLFVHKDELCAGKIERRCDGRLLRQMAADPQPSQLVAVICELMGRQGLDTDLYVVIEPDAYWPEAFPVLDNNIATSNRF